jgi:hypothetical protein
MSTDTRPATCPNCGETPHRITVRPDLDEVVCACDYAEPSEEDAVCCEACGHEVDPDVAVLAGELMVCPGCAEQGRANAVAAQFIAALDAYHAALDDQLAGHILGELADNRFQATLALMNGERYAGESDALNTAYDRKREQLQQLGYDVTAGQATGWELALVTPEPVAVATLPAGARVAVTFGPDAGQVGTVVRGPDAAGYYHVALDCGPDDWGPVWYFLPAEIALSTTPPAVERPWANDTAYVLQGDR